MKVRRQCLIIRHSVDVDHVVFAIRAELGNRLAAKISNRLAMNGCAVANTIVRDHGCLLIIFILHQIQYQLAHIYLPLCLGFALLPSVYNSQSIFLEGAVYMAMLNVGDQAPDFSLQNQDGTEITLAQLRGKNVVLWWYPKADTPG